MPFAVETAQVALHEQFPLAGCDPKRRRWIVQEMIIGIQIRGVGDVLDLATVGDLGLDLPRLKELGVEDQVPVVGP